MDFQKLVSNLLPKAASWSLIGTQLGLSQDELAAIGADSSSEQECLRLVLQKWYEKTPNPTWEAVAAAFRGFPGELEIVELDNILKGEPKSSTVHSAREGRVAYIADLSFTDHALNGLYMGGRGGSSSHRAPL
jgi:hypothetical protein